MNKPKILINILPICGKTNRIFIGKRLEDLKLSIVCGKLKYGEEFDEGGMRLIKEDIGLDIGNSKRLFFLASYNIIDKDVGLHLVGIMFYVVLTEEEVDKIFLNKYMFSAYGFVELQDIIKEEYELFVSLSVFIKKYKINTLEDIKSLNPS